MMKLEMPDRPTIDVPPASIDLPPAFYRDDEPPPPPPDDPHWREWPNGNGSEPVPRWVLIGIPAFIGIVGVLHIALILVVMNIGH